jgi:DNA-binding transcriptional regulator of glucitol operon
VRFLSKSIVALAILVLVPVWLKQVLLGAWLRYYDWPFRQMADEIAGYARVMITDISPTLNTVQLKIWLGR